MSASPRFSPIHRLFPELLLYIFEFNGNMFTDENALTTTRFTSQVCSTWRNNMLSSKSLWAHLIDIDSFHGLRSRTWGEELIKRSGDSLQPLWIKSNKHNIHPPIYDSPSCSFREQRIFFLDIISKHWGRLQRVFLNASAVCELSCPNALTMLRHPMPVLEMFYVESLPSDNGGFLPQKSPFLGLFSGDAPMLRHFSVRNDRIGINTPWLHNLHSIQLGSVYDIHACFEVLSATPNLQSLKVEGSSEHMSYFSHPVISLPELKSLTLSIDIHKVTFILDHLEIPHGCSLDLYCYPCCREEYYCDCFNTNPSAQVISSLARAFRRYFQSHPPRTINITCFQSMIDFRDSDCTFKLLCNSYDDSTDIVPAIFAALSLPELAEVTELKLQCDVVFPCLSFPTFLHYLPSVKTLHTDEETLEYFNTSQDLLPNEESCRINIFPILDLIKICALDSEYLPHPAASVSEETLQFVLSRVKDGRPISALDLTACEEPPTPSPTLLRLKELSNLKVTI